MRRDQGAGTPSRHPYGPAAGGPGGPEPRAGRHQEKDKILANFPGPDLRAGPFWAPAGNGLRPRKVRKEQLSSHSPRGPSSGTEHHHRFLGLWTPASHPSSPSGPGSSGAPNPTDPCWNRSWGQEATSGLRLGRGPVSAGRGLSHWESLPLRPGAAQQGPNAGPTSPATSFLSRGTSGQSRLQRGRTLQGPRRLPASRPCHTCPTSQPCPGHVPPHCFLSGSQL